MATVIKVRSKIDDVKRVEAYLTNGLKEEEKRISFAINKTERRLLEFEKNLIRKPPNFLKNLNRD